MTADPASLPWLGIAVAGGAGLLIGLERERRKRQPGHTAFAGVRTFTVASLAGALAQSLGQPWMVLAGALLIIGLIGIAYYRSSPVDTGTTTEIALFVTYLIGVAAIHQPVLAAGVSVAVTALLASRTRLHTFANEILSPEELRDALILAASALIVLPLAPSTPIEWLGGIDMRRIWAVVVLLLAIQAVGHVALRALGPRYGLAASGLASGFITSTGTIAALGLRARQAPAELDGCVAGALLSCVSTFVQLGVLIVALHPAAFVDSLPMLAAGTIAVIASAVPWFRRGRNEAAQPVEDRRAFSLPRTIGFALLLTAVTAATRWLDASVGKDAAVIAIGIAGFADAHAASASALTLAHTGTIPGAQLQWMMLVAISTNTVSKVVASLAGGQAYARRMVPALVAIASLAWLATLLAGSAARHV